MNRFYVPRLLVSLLLLTLLSQSCHPQPSRDDAAVVTPRSWVDVARPVLVVVRWAVPAAKLVISATVQDPGKTLVLRALDAVADAAVRLETALDVYVARGGDQCLTFALIGGLGEALIQVTQVLADHDIALGVVFERVTDGVWSLLDTLIPACQHDAGFASAGASGNARIRQIQNDARARGAVLRHLLDDLRPLDGGVR